MDVIASTKWCPRPAARLGGQGAIVDRGQDLPRHFDHSLGLSRIVRASYRSDEEVELWKQRDPITIHTALLLSQGIATQAEIEQMDAQVTQEIEEAVEFARQSPCTRPCGAVWRTCSFNPIPGVGTWS